MITAGLLRNPNVLTEPAFAALLERSYYAVPRTHDYLFAQVLRELAGAITASDRFMLAAYEDYIPKAVCYGDLPVARMFPHPILHAIYNEGSKACAKALREALVDYLSAAGYTSIIALNGTGRDDAVWLRAMLVPEAKSTPLGTLHLLELKGEE
jgi:hypothetical protein